MMTTLLQDIPNFELQPYKSLSNDELSQRIDVVRSKLGSRLLILGHHYQQDEVIAHADLRGDSYQLSQMAAASDECRTIVFCGVHFMAETADILANRPDKLTERGGERVQVILPDMAAGCSMADMAAIDQIEQAWRPFAAATGESFAPVATRRRSSSGPSSGRSGSSSSPTSTWDATHR